MWLVVVVQLLNRVWLSAIPWTEARQASLSFTISQSFLKLTANRVGDAISLTISSSFVPFSSCLQSYPASGSFPVSQLFTAGGQSTGASASVSVLSMNIQDWFPLELTGLISLQSKGLSRVFSNTTVGGKKASILWCVAFFIVQLSHPYMTTGKTIALTRWTFIGKVMSLLLNMLSTFPFYCFPLFLCID